MVHVLLGKSLSFCCCLVTNSYSTLCSPMDCSTPGFPVPHYLPEFAQVCVHWVGDATQPSHPLRPLLLLPSIFPASGSFQMSQLFASGGQSIGVSASASVLPTNIQDWFPLGWTGWISLQSKGLSSLLQHHSSKESILRHSAFFIVQLWHPYMTTGKTVVWLEGLPLVKSCLCFLICCLGWS